MVHAYRVACGTYERTVFAVDVSIDEGALSSLAGIVC